MAAKAPVFVGPKPMAAVSRRLPKVQFNESMPWLACISFFFCTEQPQKGLTQRALLVRLTCPFFVLAFHRHCPWWSTFMMSALWYHVQIIVIAAHIHSPAAKL